MNYHHKLLSFSIGFFLQSLVSQGVSASSINQDKYDEGDFKGFTFGKGYIPPKENILVKTDKPLPKLKYDEQLGYFFEKKTVKEKKNNLDNESKK